MASREPRQQLNRGLLVPLAQRADRARALRVAPPSSRRARRIADTHDGKIPLRSPATTPG